MAGRFSVHSFCQHPHLPNFLISLFRYSIRKTSLQLARILVPSTLSRSDGRWPEVHLLVSEPFLDQGNDADAFRYGDIILIISRDWSERCSLLTVCIYQPCHRVPLGSNSTSRCHALLRSLTRSQIDFCANHRAVFSWMMKLSNVRPCQATRMRIMVHHRALGPLHPKLVRRSAPHRCLPLHLHVLEG